jgi:hypothetical protein
MKLVLKYLILIFSIYVMISGCKSKTNDNLSENGINEQIIENSRLNIWATELENVKGLSEGYGNYHDKYGNSFEGTSAQLWGSDTDIEVFMQIKDYVEELLIMHGISDVTFLENLKQLRRLKLYNQNIETLEPIRHLDNLEELYIEFHSDNQTNIMDLSILRSLSNLKKLGLFSKQFENIEALEYLTNLEEIIIVSNYPETIDGSIFMNLINLKRLELSDNRLENQDVIFELPGLKIIRFYNYYKGEDGHSVIFEPNKYYIFQYRANIRKEPDRNSDVIAILNLHDEIEISENSWIEERINNLWGYWYKIKYGNITGYIFGGNIAYRALVTDIDKSGTKDYFYYRYSNGEYGHIINPLTDILIYINNQRISTNVLNTADRYLGDRPFERCIFEEGDDDVLIGLSQEGRHGYEYMHIFKVTSDGGIEFVSNWNEIDYW